MALRYNVEQAQSLMLTRSDSLHITRSRASGGPRPQGGPVFISRLFPIFYMNCLMQSDCLFKLYNVSIQHTSKLNNFLGPNPKVGGL